MELKDNLRNLLLNQDINVSELSRKTGVPINTLHNWLSGQNPQNLNQLKIVADYFKTTIDILCFGPPDYSSEEFERYKDEINAGVYEVILRKVR